MECTSAKQGKAMVVTVCGRIDSNTAPQFEQFCAKLIQGGETFLIVNLAGLDYISSAGLRSVLTTAKALKAKQGTLALCSLQKLVEEVFTVSGFATYLPIYPTLGEALA
jgi:anti-sigma B factor antagonist